MRICLIEDDLKLGRALQAALEDAGQAVTWLRRAADGRRWLAQELFDAVLLDLGLPDDSGMSLLRELRAAGLGTPVLVITARDALEDRITGLELGADDYLVKPFANAELLARIRAVVRRAAGGSAAADPLWCVRDLVLNERSRTLTRAGTAVDLSKTEFELLHTLLRQPDRVWTRRELESQVLPSSEGAALDVHVSNLRRKLGGDYIHTVRGVGFVVRR
jgi:two-component system response regulator QseB/two-component system response regulator BasR